MLLTLPDVLSADALAHFQQILSQAVWCDGRQTAGPLAIKQKNNTQLQSNDPLSRELGEHILNALSASPQFISATLPLRIFPPMFNRYAEAQEYGDHIDNAIRNTGQAYVRTDVSMTLFLSDPRDYDGGELIVNDTYGAHPVKLPAGHLVVYPGTSLHRVAPVTRGVRYAAFFWLQSMVREDAQRTLLYELDTTIQQLVAQAAAEPQITRLTGIYHNLIRLWAET